jgi:hypothetical protein
MSVEEKRPYRKEKGKWMRQDKDNTWALEHMEEESLEKLRD